MNDRNDIEQIRDATDLVDLIGQYVALKPRGREHVGLCPFHDDHSPSMAIVTHKGHAFYCCHSCGASGDAFTFVQKYLGKDFVDSLTFLAERAGVTLSQRHNAAPSIANKLRKANSDAAAFFRKMLLDGDRGKTARKMIDRRGINDEMVEAFQIGVAPEGWDNLLHHLTKRSLPTDDFLAAGLLKRAADADRTYDAFRNRLIFPICNESGAIVAFGGRRLDDDEEPKYLNSSESEIFQKSRTLYGLHLARTSIISQRTVIVAEGYTDVIACHQAGIMNVVGTLGTALTAQHGQLLGRNCDTVILLFDGDEAGRRAADRAVEVLFASPVDVAICVLPDDLDPADLLELPDGAQRFQEAVESATDALTYKLQRLQQELGARDGISSRQKVIEQFVGDLAGLGIASMDGVRRGLIMERLAEITSIPTVDLESSLLRKSSTRRGPARTSSDDETLPDDAAPAPVADIPRARRTAERNLLALLLHDPELGRDRIDDLPLATTFRDVIHRHIAQTTLELIASGDPMSMQTVLSGLDDPAASELAARLFFVGEQLLADASEDPAACLGQAVADLASCDARDTHAACDETYRANKSNPKQAQQAAREIVEQLRHAGGPVAAIAQGTRS